VFRLTKWYLDLVAEDGSVLIAYAATLEAGALGVRFASTLLAPVGAPAEERTAWTAVAMPEQAGSRLVLRHPTLELSGEWRPAAEPVEASLLDDHHGRLHWACLMPAARARATLRGTTLEGAGYAECLTMTRMPWTLPFRELQWGRWVGERHHAVWIKWTDGTDRHWLWLDGSDDPSPRGLEELEGDRSLELTASRQLCDRRALRVLTTDMPALEPLFAGPLGNLRETKQVSRGTLRERGTPIDHGWAIHEVVRW
jgi:hypothetical protein